MHKINPSVLFGAAKVRIKYDVGSENKRSFSNFLIENQLLMKIMGL
jgi:hypothetical protein